MMELESLCLKFWSGRA